MADEEDPWGFDDTETTEAPAEATKQETLAAVEGEAATVETQPTEGEPKPEEVVEEALPPPPPEDDGYRKPVQLYRHWVRPKFLQYKYMYNYRTNYYDDVIDYLDKRQVGLPREIPRAQTWAERVLRTNYPSGRYLDPHQSAYHREKHLIQTLAASIRPHNYHTKAYVNMKYGKVL